MRRYHSGILVSALCVLVGVAAPAHAHDLGLSGIRFLHQDDRVIVTVTTPISRLLRAEGQGHTTLNPAQLDQAIRRRLHLRFDGKALLPQNANVIGDNFNDILSWQAAVPGKIRECEVLARLYPEDPASRTLVIQLQDGQVTSEALLDSAQPALVRSRPPSVPLTVAARYIREGVGHIFGGPDHILFVLGLLLLGGGLNALLRTITAFTLAHSITLTLAATGIWSPSPRIVEPLIALSIVAIAVENLRQFRRGNAPGSVLEPAPSQALSSRNRRDLRPYYAFGFGLVHGFGFAGALAEVGLPGAALGIALASFNVGVEVGQVAIVLTALPLLAWLGKTHPAALRHFVLTGSILIGAAGAYWFVSRLNPS